MLPRTVLAALLLAAACVALPSPSAAIAKASESTADDSEVKQSLQRLNFIPREIMCTLCHRTIEGLQERMRADPIGFQIDQLRQCDTYADIEDQVKCREAFTDRQKMTDLMKPDAADTLCVTRLMCQPEEKPLPRETIIITPGPPPPPAGLEAIPVVDEDSQ